MTNEELNTELEGYTFDKRIETADGKVGWVYQPEGSNAGESKTVICEPEAITVE